MTDTLLFCMGAIVVVMALIAAAGTAAYWLTRVFFDMIGAPPEHDRSREPTGHGFTIEQTLVEPQDAGPVDHDNPNNPPPSAR